MIKTKRDILFQYSKCEYIRGISIDNWYTHTYRLGSPNLRCCRQGVGTAEQHPDFGAVLRFVGLCTKIVWRVHESSRAPGILTASRGSKFEIN